MVAASTVGSSPPLRAPTMMNSATIPAGISTRFLAYQAFGVYVTPATGAAASDGLGAKCSVHCWPSQNC
jgi:hypothetical protein